MHFDSQEQAIAYCKKIGAWLAAEPGGAVGRPPGHTSLTAAPRFGPLAPTPPGWKYYVHEPREPKITPKVRCTPARERERPERVRSAQLTPFPPHAAELRQQLSLVQADAQEHQVTAKPRPGASRPIHMFLLSVHGARGAVRCVPTAPRELGMQQRGPLVRLIIRGVAALEICVGKAVQRGQKAAAVGAVRRGNVERRRRGQRGRQPLSHPRHVARGV